MGLKGSDINDSLSYLGLWYTSCKYIYIIYILPLLHPAPPSQSPRHVIIAMDSEVLFLGQSTRVHTCWPRSSHTQMQTKHTQCMHTQSSRLGGGWLITCRLMWGTTHAPCQTGTLELDRLALYHELWRSSHFITLMNNHRLTKCFI